MLIITSKKNQEAYYSTVTTRFVKVTGIALHHTN